LDFNHSSIHELFAASLTTQTYEAKDAIEGVRRIALKQMIDDGGSFSELLRFDEQGIAEAAPGFQVRQCSFSIIQPGAIKAFHLHFRQDDIWYVPPTDRMLVGLLDARADSPTAKVSMRVILGAGRAELLFIPRGVAHGVVNQQATPGAIFYFVNQQFDMQDPDERRLPWDVLGEEFWEMTPG
jgi:dTDP-4-dehydrorhamnose 3,5-epimerase